MLQDSLRRVKNIKTEKYRFNNFLNSFLVVSQFSIAMSDLVFRTDKIIILGEFNMHVDIENDTFRNGFITLLGFFQLTKF